MNHSPFARHRHLENVATGQRCVTERPHCTVLGNKTPISVREHMVRNSSFHKIKNI